MTAAFGGVNRPSLRPSAASRPTSQPSAGVANARPARAGAARATRATLLAADIAAPRACTTRKHTRAVRFGAREQAAEAGEKTAKP